MREEIFPGRSLMNKRNNNGPRTEPWGLQIELHMDHYECYLIQLPDVY